MVWLKVVNLKQISDNLGHCMLGQWKFASLVGSTGGMAPLAWKHSRHPCCWLDGRIIFEMLILGYRFNQIFGLELKKNVTCLIKNTT